MQGSTSPAKKGSPSCSHSTCSRTRRTARCASAPVGSSPNARNNMRLHAVEVHSGKSVPCLSGGRDSHHLMASAEVSLAGVLLSQWPSCLCRASNRAPQPSVATRARSAATLSSGVSIRSRMTCQRIAGSESINQSRTSIRFYICLRLESARDECVAKPVHRFEHLVQVMSQPDRPSSGIGHGQLTIFDCGYWLSVQGIVPTTLAAINVRSAGSHTSTVPFCVSAISAVIDAGLTGTVSVRSSSVTIMTSNCPSPPSVPATQFALRIFTFQATGPLRTAINMGVFFALVLTPWYAPRLSFTSDAALVFYGASMLLAAVRGYGGCEVQAISNWVLRTDDQVGCFVLGPVDDAERRLRQRQAHR